MTAAKVRVASVVVAEQRTGGRAEKLTSRSRDGRTTGHGTRKLLAQTSEHRCACISVGDVE
jgi:hypothetical protein